MIPRTVLKEKIRAAWFDAQYSLAEDVREALERAESEERLPLARLHFDMLPNLFPGAGDQPEYNTADASLWFFEAWRAYVDATGDIDSLREVYPILSDMPEGSPRDPTSNIEEQLWR